MKKHIFYFLITLFIALSLPLHAVGLDDVSEVVTTQEIALVDINKADVDTLILLKGVGEKRAKAIVAYRELHGEFTTVDDLLNVKGIGEQMLQHNKERIKL